jgi:hypothetical protein
MESPARAGMRAKRRFPDVSCTGFAYGEGGDLTLVRIRNQREIDRLVLTPLFEHADVNMGGIAILQRWSPDYKADFAASERDDFIDLVGRRPTVKIMDFIDYDHDGQRSEFYLKTDTLPCGLRGCIFLEVFQNRPNLSSSKSIFGKR